MTNINPCPFCEGPPCIQVKDSITGNKLYAGQCEEGVSMTSYVWCHECAARGPEVDSDNLAIFENKHDLTFDEMEQLAVQKWNDRHNRSRHLYEKSGGAE
ncbi:Lar family restriction alleviation protein [Pseudomonas sp.]|uniref:Lar family restriction alleviation protein n=1 Tax=Pseudomonas sp. TaxID=306 RepID=UPI00289A0A46|nr:Lar family restriction alleviation protein [Pseudomonas sp.]